MSVLSESRQQAALRIQAEQLTKLISPSLEIKLKGMVDQLKIELLLEMEEEIKRKVKEQVEAYCKTAFDTGAADDEHFHMIREQSDERPYDTRPNSPSSIEADKFVLADPPVLARDESKGWWSSK